MLSKEEMAVTATIAKDLNCYQILKISNLASEDEIREAFHREAMAFHPDQYFAEEDKEILELSKLVYAKIVNAYQTLTNREKREKYDKALERGLSDSGKVIIDEDAITSIKRKSTSLSTSPGEKFYKLAEKAFQSRDYRSATMNIQIALGSEPENSKFIELKKKIERQK